MSQLKLKAASEPELVKALVRPSYEQVMQHMKTVSENALEGIKELGFDEDINGPLFFLLCSMTAKGLDKQVYESEFKSAEYLVRAALMEELEG